MKRTPSNPTALRRKLHLFKETLGEIHAANAHIPPDEIQKVVDDAVSEVRAERHPATFGAVKSRRRWIANAVGNIDRA